MPNTYSAIFHHLVFSTKHREPRIRPDIETRVWEYLGGIVSANDGLPLRVGGIENHVHLLVGMTPSAAPARLVQQIKCGSSKWLHENFPDMADFAWQDGYGVFSVSRSAIPEVSRYIDNQREHHRHKTFEDEYRAFLKRHGVAFDERYLF